MFDKLSMARFCPITLCIRHRQGLKHIAIAHFSDNIKVPLYRLQ